MKFTIIACLLILGFGVWAGGGSLEFTYQGKVHRYEAKPHFKIILDEKGELAIWTPQ